MKTVIYFLLSMFLCTFFGSLADSYKLRTFFKYNSQEAKDFFNDVHCLLVWNFYLSFVVLVIHFMLLT